jgi:adenine deaminase
LRTAYGLSIHRELALLVAAGLRPTEALAAAASAPASCFGLADRGRIGPGLRADLVLVEGDPTVNVTATRSIVSVWRQGQRVDREAYRSRIAAMTPPDHLVSPAVACRILGVVVCHRGKEVNR